MKSYFLLLPIYLLGFGFYGLPQETSRRLLLFGKDYEEFSIQLKWLGKDSSGLAERDIVIEKLDSTSSVAKKFKVSSKEFTVLLIGKDGSVKYRDNKPIDTKKLFALIDSMPMRKEELEKKSRN